MAAKDVTGQRRIGLALVGAPLVVGVVGPSVASVRGQRPYVLPLTIVGKLAPLKGTQRRPPPRHNKTQGIVAFFLLVAASTFRLTSRRRPTALENIK